MGARTGGTGTLAPSTVALDGSTLVGGVLINEINSVLGLDGVDLGSVRGSRGMRMRGLRDGFADGLRKFGSRCLELGFWHLNRWFVGRRHRWVSKFVK